MAASPPSPALLSADRTGPMSLVSPSSDKQFWSVLRGRIDTLLESRDDRAPTEPTQIGSERAKRRKEDAMLLLRGFDSVAHSLSQLSDNIDNALQGARDLGKPPTLTDIFHGSLRDAKPSDEVKAINEEEEQNQHGLKRKFESSSTDDQVDDLGKEVNQSPKNAKLKRAKNLAVSIAAKASSFARELKSVKSDLSFVQERCVLLEEENRRLREGFSKGIRPEDDDLVRLQLETLLAEKSRLANENANLVRENQCLNQLVTYHQMTSQDLSDSYEQVIEGLCLDFSSPTQTIFEEEDDDGNVIGERDSHSPAIDDAFGVSTSLEKRFQDEEEKEEE